MVNNRYSIINQLNTNRPYELQNFLIEKQGDK